MKKIACSLIIISGSFSGLIFAQSQQAPLAQQENQEQQFEIKNKSDATFYYSRVANKIEIDSKVAIEKISKSYEEATRKMTAEENTKNIQLKEQQLSELNVLKEKMAVLNNKIENTNSQHELEYEAMLSTQKENKESLLADKNNDIRKIENEKTFELNNINIELSYQLEQLPAASIKK
jgi:hypothetical protein